jgi:hypothetical protein
VQNLKKKVDEMICAATPETFLFGRGWYGDFSQTTDEEVCKMLEKHRAFRQSKFIDKGGKYELIIEYWKRNVEVRIPVDSAYLEETCRFQKEPEELLFSYTEAEAAATARATSTLQRVSEEGLATLLFDLLTVEEERIYMLTRSLRFDKGFSQSAS